MTYLEIAARGRNAAWRYLLCVVLAVGLCVLGGIAIMTSLTLLHLMPKDLAQQLRNPDRPTVFFAFTALSFGLLLLGFVLAMRLMHAKRFGDMLGVWRWRALARGAAIWAAVLVVSTGLDFALAPKGFALTANGQTAALILTAIPALALQTFTEEFIFRGYVTQGFLLATRRPWLAAILAGLAFGALHIPNGAPQALNAVAFGIALSLIAIHTRSLAFGYGVHLINNIFGAVVLVSGGDVFKGSPGLITQTTPQLAWWDVFVAAAAVALVAWGVLARKPADAAQI